MSSEIRQVPKNYWLIRFRQWHTWIGVGSAWLLLIVAATGISLNHKDTFLYQLGLAERKPPKPESAGKLSKPPEGYRMMNKDGTAGGLNWGKLIKDLHTGKIGGFAGQLLVDLLGAVVIFLSCSGVWLWGTVISRRWRSGVAKGTVFRPPS